LQVINNKSSNKNITEKNVQITELSARNPLTEQDKSFNSPIKKETKSVSKAVIENAFDI
jgi:hypothetical protein